MTDTSNGPAIAALAREVETLREGTVEVPTLKRRVDELAQLVATLAERTSGRSTGGEESSPVPSWLALRGSGSEAVAAVLRDLLPWVEDVYLAYDDAALPECWLWHPGVVEELVWLMHDWRAAYPSGEDDGYNPAAATWHDRYRPGVVARINDIGRSCSLVKHTGRSRRTAPLHQAADEIATWWGSSPDQTAPVPSDWHFDLADTAHREEVLSR